MTMDFDILEELDPDVLVDVLGITTEELLDRFEDKVLEYYERQDKDEDSTEERD